MRFENDLPMLDVPDDQIRLESALAQVKAGCQVVARHVGPRTITYQVVPVGDVRVSRVKSAIPDISVRLGSATCLCREEGGKLFIELTRDEPEIPNRLDRQETVDPRDILVGFGVGDHPVTVRLEKMPHGIIAGTSGCLHGDTPIHDPVDGTTQTVRERWAAGVGFHVWAMGAQGPVRTAALPPERFPPAQMARVRLSNGETMTVTLQHRLMTVSGWRSVSEVYEWLQGSEPCLLPTNSDTDLQVHARDAFRWSHTTPGSLVDCHPESRSGDEPLHQPPVRDQESSPSPRDAREHTPHYLLRHGPACAEGHSRSCQSFDLHSTQGSVHRSGRGSEEVPPLAEARPELGTCSNPSTRTPHANSGVPDTTVGPHVAALHSTAVVVGATHDGDAEASRPQWKFPGAPPSGESPLRCRNTQHELPPQSRGEESENDSANRGPWHNETECSHRSLHGVQSPSKGRPHPTTHEFGTNLSMFTSCTLGANQPLLNVVAVVKVELLSMENYFDFHVPVFNNYWLAGVWNHNCGKSVLMRNIVRSIVRIPNSLTMIMDPKGGADYTLPTSAPGRVFLIDKADHIRCWTNIARDEMDVRQGVRKLPSGLRLDPTAPLVLVFDEIQSVVDDQSIRANLFRILSMGRSAGVHCILATQAPSAKVLGGNEMRVNAPTRIVLKTATSSDSRVALTESGAEKLLGSGDAIMLYDGKKQRIQVPYLSADDMYNELED